MRMSYASVRDELFFADIENHVVRMIHLRGNESDLRDVYRAEAGNVISVDYLKELDAVLVGSYELNMHWLTALTRSGNHWRVAHRALIQAPGGLPLIANMLSGSRVLIGQQNSTYLELIRVDSGPRITRLHQIKTKQYMSFASQERGVDWLVAMSFMYENTVRMYRLRDGFEKLEELERIPIEALPYRLVWLGSRLLVTAYDLKSKYNSRELNKFHNIVIELEGSDTGLKRRQLIGSDELILVYSWCAVNNGIAIFDGHYSKDILHYEYNESF